MGETVPLKQAAKRLGISTDTVRRRIKSGSLEAEKRATPQGGEWWVTLPDDAPGEDPDTMQEAGDAAQAVELAVLRARLIELEARAAELRDERDAWRDQATASREAEAQLRVLVQQAQALAGALPAGGASGEQAYAAPHDAHAPANAEDQQARSRPWWRFSGR